jgi:hypothetical protein
MVGSYYIGLVNLPFHPLDILHDKVKAHVRNWNMQFGFQSGRSPQGWENLDAIDVFVKVSTTQTTLSNHLVPDRRVWPTETLVADPKLPKAQYGKLHGLEEGSLTGTIHSYGGRKGSAHGENTSSRSSLYEDKPIKLI